MRKRFTTRVLIAVMAGVVTSTLLGSAGQAAQDEATKIDTAISRATAGMEQPADNPAVTGPTDPHQPVVLSGPIGDIKLRLPTTDTAGKGTHTSMGTTIYTDSRSDADIAVQTLADGVRALVTIQNANAPHEYRFPLSLPADYRLEMADDASETINIVAGNESVKVIAGQVSAPWAKDFSGKPVPTKYRVVDGAVIQTIFFDEKLIFPIVADPHVRKTKYGSEVLFNKQETKIMMAGAASVAAIALFIPEPSISKVVAGAGALVAAWAAWADATDGCVGIKAVEGLGAVPWINHNSYCK
ncbi:MAG: hypothetical protein H0T78_04820 [Longispora sp.]|nr:hypothetical protein [Longispora sp. (in: high G+C Gram-positive bacteria)]